MRQEENGSGQAARVPARDLLDRGRDASKVIGPELRRDEDDTGVTGPAPQVLWSSRDWAAAVAHLSVTDPLPTRTALVPREAVAHSLRRELVRAGLSKALPGTRFLPTPTAAVEVLEAGGVSFTTGEEGRRRARVVALLSRGLPLEHFSLDLLQTRPGWDEALARTIHDLEGAGFTPDHLLRDSAPPGLGDLAAIWRALDESAARSWTTQRMYVEAARVLACEPGLWPWPGSVLATADVTTTAAEARFLRAIPGLVLALRAARPMRTHYLDRMKALFGRDVAEALRGAEAPRTATSERDLLGSYLFEPAPVLAAPDRPRSGGPDGTVELEEHSGVEEELEATADWVGRQVLEGTALEDIAVLLPALDPLAGLVGDRLARLPWAAGPMPIHVDGGLPLVGTAAGARLLAVVRALRSHLAGERLAPVLPALRCVAPGSHHISQGAASDLVWSLGTTGGNPAHPGGALDWGRRLAQREPDLDAQLAAARAAEGDPEQSGLARQARDLERLLADLRAVRPALEGLVAVARLVVDQAPLREIWPALRTFAREWLLEPGEGPRAEALLDERLAILAADMACGALAGVDALRLIEDVTTAIRLASGRFGEPAVYVGTVQAAVGLRFRAVRVIGLAEGHLPPLPREDPVIPDALRSTLRGPGTSAAIPTAAVRAIGALHALDAVIRDAERCVTLSAPRRDVDRSDREPGSVMLEAAAALGRPNAVTGERGPLIPTLPTLRRDAFLASRRARAALRSSLPLGEAAWQDAVANGTVGPPARWAGPGALNLDRITALLSGGQPGPMDGILGSTAAGSLAVPGLSPDWPTSPSALQVFLQCPHQFLLANMLGFEEPAAAPPQREIGQPAYGALVHRVAEEFYRLHGAEFCARQDTLEVWRARADTLIERAFDRFLNQYPLVGGAVRNQQRERLRRDVQDLLQHDWRRAAAHRFIAVERSFGRPAPVELTLGSDRLFVRGQIDRIDVEGALTVIRDVKTGRPHPRQGTDAAPEPIRDVQIAVYGLVARRLSAEWRVPARVGAVYVYVGRGPDERSYRDDFHDVLEPAAREWLGTAVELLADRSFPRTPTPKDCDYCPFQPVCGDGVHERARTLLQGRDGALARFGSLKRATHEEED
jgi:hypothetical protein